MIEHIKSAGVNGKLKGAIWYQGESDVIWTPSDVKAYPDVLKRFIEDFRKATGNPDLPFIVVQIARFWPDCLPGQPGTSYKGEKYDNLFQVYTDGWNFVQNAQMEISNQLNSVWTVSTVDLYPMADSIHIDNIAQERLGQRIAEIALTNVYKKAGHAKPIKLSSVDVQGNNILIRFNGVNGRLTAPGRPHGFELRYTDISPGTFNAQNTNIYPIDVQFIANEPNAVLLKSGTAVNFNLKPVLYYGYGTNPYCNIVDEKDIAIPAFGPFELHKP